MQRIHIESPEGKSKKNLWFKIIFIIINVATIAVLLTLELKKGNVLNIKEAFTVLLDNIQWLILAFSLFLVNFFADTVCYFILIKEITGESRLPLSLKVSLIGKYGDGITPLGTGGQPFQMYLLHKYNIDLPKATSIPLARTVPKVIGYNLVMLVFFLFLAQKGSPIVKTTAYIGLLLNSFLPFVIIFFSFNRPLGFKITKIILKLGHKLKIVKDYEKSRIYWIKKVDEMLGFIKYFNTHPTLVIKIFMLAVLEVLALASIPYCIYRAFGGANPEATYILMVTSTMYVMSASAIAPTPGTSGVAESSFYLIFTAVITNGLMFYAVLTWRIITFYSMIIGGVFLLIYESIYKRKDTIDAQDEAIGRITNSQRALSEEAEDNIPISDITPPTEKMSKQQ